MALSTSGLHYCPGLQADFHVISTPIALCRKKCLPIESPSAHRSWKKQLWKLFLSCICQLGLQWFIDSLGCSRGRSPRLAPSAASQDISRNISSAYRRRWCWWEKGWKQAPAGSSGWVPLPELMSCTADEWHPVVPRRAFSQKKCDSDAVVLGSQLRVCTEERQESWNRREALLCLIFPGQTACSVPGLQWHGWRLLSTGDLLNLFLSLVPKGYNSAILKSTRCI